MKKLIIQIQEDKIKAALIESANKMVVLGLFPVKGKSLSAVKSAIDEMAKELKLKIEPTIILPEPGIYPNSENWKLAKQQISSCKSQAIYEAKRGIFKKQGTFLLLELGSSVNLVVVQKDKQDTFAEHKLDRLVADFREAISEPHESRYLQDFCSNHFFLKKAGKNGLELHGKLDDGINDAAELFVEYGANMGALLANLDTLYEPNCIAICGSLSKTFDAWSHAMGKMRNYHRAKKPACRVIPIKEKSNSAILGANLF